MGAAGSELEPNPRHSSFGARKRHPAVSILATECGGFERCFYGSDGNGTRNLRRDGPVAFSALLHALSYSHRFGRKA